MVVARPAVTVLGAILLGATRVTSQCARLPSETAHCIEEQTQIQTGDDNRNLQCTANDVGV